MPSGKHRDFDDTWKKEELEKSIKGSSSKDDKRKPKDKDRDRDGDKDRDKNRKDDDRRKHRDDDERKKPREENGDVKHRSGRSKDEDKDKDKKRRPKEGEERDRDKDRDRDRDKHRDRRHRDEQDEDNEERRHRKHRDENEDRERRHRKQEEGRDRDKDRDRDKNRDRDRDKDRDRRHRDDQDENGERPHRKHRDEDDEDRERRHRKHRERENGDDDRDNRHRRHRDDDNRKNDEDDNEDADKRSSKKKEETEEERRKRKEKEREREKRHRDDKDRKDGKGEDEEERRRRHEEKKKQRDREREKEKEKERDEENEKQRQRDKERQGEREKRERREREKEEKRKEPKVKNTRKSRHTRPPLKQVPRRDYQPDPNPTSPRSLTPDSMTDTYIVLDQTPKPIADKISLSSNSSQLNQEYIQFLEENYLVDNDFESSSDEIVNVVRNKGGNDEDMVIVNATDVENSEGELGECGTDNEDSSFVEVGEELVDIKQLGGDNRGSDNGAKRHKHDVQCSDISGENDRKEAGSDNGECTAPCGVTGSMSVTSDVIRIPTCSHNHTHGNPDADANDLMNKTFTIDNYDAGRNMCNVDPVGDYYPRATPVPHNSQTYIPGKTHASRVAARPGVRPSDSHRLILNVEEGGNMGGNLPKPVIECSPLMKVDAINLEEIRKSLDEMEKLYMLEDRLKENGSDDLSDNKENISGSVSSREGSRNDGILPFGRSKVNRYSSSSSARSEENFISPPGNVRAARQQVSPKNSGSFRKATEISFGAALKIVNSRSSEVSTCSYVDKSQQGSSENDGIFHKGAEIPAVAAGVDSRASQDSPSSIVTELATPRSEAKAVNVLGTLVETGECGTEEGGGTESQLNKQSNNKHNQKSNDKTGENTQSDESDNDLVEIEKECLKIVSNLTAKHSSDGDDERELVEKNKKNHASSAYDKYARTSVAKNTKNETDDSSESEKTTSSKTRSTAKESKPKPYIPVGGNSRDKRPRAVDPRTLTEDKKPVRPRGGQEGSKVEPMSKENTRGGRYDNSVKTADSKSRESGKQNEKGTVSKYRGSVIDDKKSTDSHRKTLSSKSMAEKSLEKGSSKSPLKPPTNRNESLDRNLRQNSTLGRNEQNKRPSNQQQMERPNSLKRQNTVNSGNRSAAVGRSPQNQPERSSARKPSPQNQPERSSARKPSPQNQPERSSARKPSPQNQPERSSARKPSPQNQPERSSARKPSPQNQPERSNARKPSPQNQPERNSARKPASTPDRSDRNQSKTSPTKPKVSPTKQSGATSSDNKRLAAGEKTQGRYGVYGSKNQPVSGNRQKPGSNPPGNREKPRSGNQPNIVNKQQTGYKYPTSSSSKQPEVCDTARGKQQAEDTAAAVGGSDTDLCDYSSDFTSCSTEVEQCSNVSIVCVTTDQAGEEKEGDEDDGYGDYDDDDFEDYDDDFEDDDGGEEASNKRKRRRRKKEPEEAAGEGESEAESTESEHHSQGYYTSLHGWNAKRAEEEATEEDQTDPYYQSPWGAHDGEHDAPPNNEVNDVMAAMNEENERLMAQSKRLQQQAARTHDDESSEEDERSNTQNSRSRPKTAQRTFINFVSAKQREITGKAASKTVRRAKELSELIELDIARFDLFDMPPVNEYELYMRSFGSSNTRQAYIQTNEDNIDRDIQTDEIETREIWVQNTADAIDNVGGPDFEKAELSYEAQTPQEAAQRAQRWQRVLNATLILLEEEAAERIQGAEGASSKESRICLSEGFTELDTHSLQLLKERAVIFSNFSPVQTNMLLTVHKNTHQNGSDRLSGQGVMCVWNVNSPQAPQKVLLSESPPRCCCFSPSRDTLAFAGMADGSVAVWDLREPSDMHRSHMDGETELALRYPTYSTAGVLQYDNHVSAVIAIQPIVTTHDSTAPADPDAPAAAASTEEGEGLSFQLATLEENSVINLWVVAEMSHSDPAGSESDLGLSPGGRVKLIKSSTIVLESPLRDTRLRTTMHAFDMKLLPSNNSHFYVATDTGCVIHGVRYGGKAPPRVHYGEIESPVRITALDFSPFPHPVFLVGCEDGTLRLHHTSSQYPLITWPDATNGSAIRAVRWCRSRPSVFFVLDDDSRMHIWDLLMSDAVPMKFEQIAEERVLSIDLCNDHSATGVGLPGRKPQMVISLESGSTEVHTLSREFSALMADENDQFSQLIQRIT